MVWSVLAFFDHFSTERSTNFKAIVTDRWRIPSQMPWSYARTLAEGAARRPGDVRVQPQDSMTWQFYVGTVDAGLDDAGETSSSPSPWTRGRSAP